MGPGRVRADAETNKVLTPPSAPRRRRRGWIILPAAVVLALWVFRAPLLTALGRFLDVSEQPRPAEFVMILGGDRNYRPAVAAALYKVGLAGAVLIPPLRSAADAPSGQSLRDDETIARVVRARGVPEASILRLPGKVDSTADEAATLSRFLEDHPANCVTVVTTDYHTRRARMLFSRVDLHGAQVHFVAAPDNQCDATDWWQSERGCTIYLTELVKLAAYALGR